MNILLVGSGGREHALAWKIRQSPLVTKLYIAPGNGGTALEGENVPIQVGDIPALVAFAVEKSIDLVVTGPELPLVLGLKNALDEKKIACFGPDAYAAQLEGSKAFAKSVMQEAEVPTADFAIFDDFERAKDYLKKQTMPVVIKADGLAAGKGVVIVTDVDQGLQTLREMMEEQVFDSAGTRVVIEEALEGEEASFLAFCDGHTVIPLPSAQDHKRIGEGDTGPNTGGMGAYSPAPILTRKDYQSTSDLVIKPIIQHMDAMGHPFTGILYAGIMYTAKGPYVLEYNVRFGDPECQPLLARLDTDIVEIMLACTRGRLHEIDIAIKPEHCLCVVMAAEGYPGKYAKGLEISGIADADACEGVKVFQAGTRMENGTPVTSGGRVLGVTALGKDLATAKARAYEAEEKIHFEGKYCRKDIGDKGLARS